MSLDSKVIWTEGMFLNPQHFQQQERYFERYIEGKVSAYGAYGWGIQELDLDSEMLKLGKISILNAKGVFPDGTPFNFPENDEAPPVIDVPAGTQNSVVYLAVPVRRPGAVDVFMDEEAQGLARYFAYEHTIRDVTLEGSDNVPVNVGKLRIRCLLEKDDLSGYACVGVARISESREDKNVLLDDEYIPPCLDVSKMSKLSAFLSELAGLLHHRGESIAGRLADVQRGGSAEIADYMMLQMINRLEPMAAHLATLRGLHPLALYTEAVQMAGELATFATKTKRPTQFPPYRHEDLQNTFIPVVNALRQNLSMVYEQTATALPLVEKKYGIRVAQIPDRSMIGTSTFILAARADLPADAIRSHLPGQMKIGPVERIRQLVNAAMPGIPIKPLPVAPRQIPYHSGFTYFELDSGSEFWKELKSSGGFALHVGGDFPGLELEFWTIRN